MRKKLLCIMLAFCMMLSLCGCAIVRVTKVEQEKPDVAVDDTMEPLKEGEDEEESPSGDENETEDPAELPEDEPEPVYPQLAEDDPKYEGIMKMLGAVEGILNYSSLTRSGEAVSLTGISAEEFWMYLAFAVAKYEAVPDNLDQFGNIDLPREKVISYAESILTSAYVSAGLPSLENVNSVSTEDNKTLTFTPMSVASKVTVLEGFWEDNYRPDTYILRTAVYDTDEEGVPKEGGAEDVYEVALKAWTDTGDHAFDYMLSEIRFVEHTDAVPAEEEPSENGTESDGENASSENASS